MQKSKLFTKSVNLLKMVLKDGIKNGEGCCIADLYQVANDYDYEQYIQSEMVVTELGAFNCLQLVNGYYKDLYKDRNIEYNLSDDLCKPYYVASSVLYIVGREIVKEVFASVLADHNEYGYLSDDECEQCLHLLEQAVKNGTLTTLWVNLCSKY